MQYFKINLVNKKLRIAIYSGEIPSTTFIERLIKAIASSDNDLLLFGGIKSKTPYGKGVYVLGYYNNKLYKFWSLVKYSCLLFLFKNSKKKRLDQFLVQKNKNDLHTRVKYYPVLWHAPDIFHIQWAKGLKDWIWVQEFGMKLVLSLRGAHINYSPIVDSSLANIYQQNFPNIDGYHAVSKAIANEAAKYGAKRVSIQVIKSGLNLEDFRFKLRTLDLSVPLKILSIGRNHWKKNYRQALDTMYNLKQKNIPFVYDIIGVEFDESLMFQREQLGLGNVVHFIHKQSFEEVRNAIQQSDVLFLPSVEEGIANVVLEAMAMGTLVVSTDCGGMAEVVFPNETGFLVPNRDIQAMTETLSEVSKMSLLDYQRITKQARVFIENHHSEDQMVEGMLELYEKVMRGK